MGGDKKKLAVRNIGMILSGRIEQPVLDGDCVVAVGGRTEAFGFEKDMDMSTIPTSSSTRMGSRSPQV